jgi:TatD DNase family protein
LINLPAALFDSHAHLDFDFIAKNRAELLRQARAQGIQGWLIPSTGRQNWQSVLQICAEEEGCVAALGLHPYLIEQHQMEDVAPLRRMLIEHRNQVVAIGECGLDATIGNFPKQQQLLRTQLELARELDLPVVLHSRKTHSELLGELQRAGIRKGVVHAFTGNTQQLEQFVNLGLKIGVGPAVAWPRASKTREAIRQAPLSALVLETDAPDMPCPGEKRCETSLLGLLRVLEVLVELRAETREAMAEQMLCNAHEVFRFTNF